MEVKGKGQKYGCVTCAAGEPIFPSVVAVADDGAVVLFDVGGEP